MGRGHGDEMGRQHAAVRHAEADVGCAACGVDAQLLAQPAYQSEHLNARRGHGTHRHDQRIDHDVMGRDAVIGRALDDLARHLEAHVGILGDARLVIADGHHRHVMLLHQRQNGLEPVLLAGDRIDQRTAFRHLQTGCQRAGYGGIDAQRKIGDLLHHFDGAPHQRRLRLVGVDRRDAGVHVEDVRAGLRLGDGVGPHRIEIAFRHFRRQLLATGGIDALANDGERRIETDDVFAGLGCNDGSGHGLDLPR